MATNIVVPDNKSRVLNKLLKSIGKSTTLGEVGLKNPGHARRRLWSSAGVPSCLKAQYDTSPYDLLQVGDFAYDSSNDHAYVCTVEVAASTDATFTKVSVD